MSAEFEKSVSPFGLHAGLETDWGIVSITTEVIHVYVWNGCSWVTADPDTLFFPANRYLVDILLSCKIIFDIPLSLINKD